MSEDARHIMLSARQIDRWIGGAKAGDVLLYARQPVRGLIRATVDHVQALETLSLVRHEAQRRCPADRHLFEYRVRRTALTVDEAKDRARGAGRHVVTHRERADALFAARAESEAAAAVLETIARAAAAGARCPSDAAIAAATGESPWRVRGLLAGLQSAGDILFSMQRGPGGLPLRVATLPGGGATWAPADPAAAPVSLAGRAA